MLYYLDTSQIRNARKKSEMYFITTNQSWMVILEVVFATSNPLFLKKNWGLLGNVKTLYFWVDCRDSFKCRDSFWMSGFENVGIPWFCGVAEILWGVLLELSILWLHYTAIITVIIFHSSYVKWGLFVVILRFFQGVQGFEPSTESWIWKV